MRESDHGLQMPPRATLEGAAGSDRLTSRLALGGILGPVLLIGAFTVAGWLRPGYSAIHHVVSDLGIGPKSWIVNGAGLLNALLLTAWVVAFLRRTRTMLSVWRRWVCAALLEVPALGYAFASLFTNAHATRPIHTVAAELALAFPVVVFFVLGLVFRSTPWRDWSAYSFLASLATLILVAATVSSFTPGSRLAAADVEGLMERALLVETLGWYMYGGWRVARRVG